MAYRFLIDSTRATIARFPGAHDVVMDTLTDQPAALCTHYETQICEGAFSWAPAIQTALEAAIRKPLYLTDEETREVVAALRAGKGAHPTARLALAADIANLRGIK
jgi:hypothetical protein